MALAAIGLKTSFSEIRNIGFKPMTWFIVDTSSICFNSGSVKYRKTEENQKIMYSGKNYSEIGETSMYISETPITVRYAKPINGSSLSANYAVWFELGRTKKISDLGFRYHEIEAQGVVAPVLDIQVSLKPARYGDRLQLNLG